MLGIGDLYPSRVGCEERIMERIDPVVYGDGGKRGEYGLDAEQVAAYERDGFIILEGYMSDMVAPLLDEVERLKTELAGRPECVQEPDSNAVRSLFKVHAFSEVMERFVRSARMLSIAEQLLGGPVYVHQSRVNIKPAVDGRSFPWHSDFETWHVEDGLARARTVTGWIMLTENTPDNGPLFVIPGSHHRYVSCAGKTGRDNHLTSLKRQVLGSPSLKAVRELAKDGGVKGIYGRPGTVVFHECNILHGSPDNISPWPRTNLFCVYNSIHNPPHEPFGAPRSRPDYLAERTVKALTPA